VDIKIPYNIGERVWFEHCGQWTAGPIEQIYVHLTRQTTALAFVFAHPGAPGGVLVCSPHQVRHQPPREVLASV